MLDSIRTLNDLPASSDARIPREEIVATRQRHALQKQAQRRARDCVDQAQRDADAVRAQAFQEGYAEGVLRAAENLTRGLLESQALGLQLRSDLAQAIRQLLGDSLRHTQWLDEMLERWLAEQPGPTDAVMQVLLPLRCKPRGDELRQRLQALWPGTLSLDYQPQERYVFRLADQLLEFDIEASAQRLEPRLLSSLANLPESVRRLDQSSRLRLRELCSSFGEMPHEG
jgi:hypothetical protein